MADQDLLKRVKALEERVKKLEEQQIKPLTKRPGRQKDSKVTEGAM